MRILVESTKNNRGRIEYVDALRGLAIVFMVPDHVLYFLVGIHPREFWGIAPPVYDGFPTVYFLRSLSHMTAPLFFMLLGVGVSLLSLQAEVGEAHKIDKKLFKRSVLLILAQIFLENAAWGLGHLGPASHLQTLASGEIPGTTADWKLFLGVLFTLGICLSLLTLIRRLASKLLIFGVIIIFIISSTAEYISSVQASGSVLSTLLVLPGVNGHIEIFYPILPWLGFSMVGLVIGRSLKYSGKYSDVDYLMVVGGLAVGASILLFSLNTGDHYAGYAPTIGSVFLVTKYPPSARFILMTIGLSMILFSMFKRVYNGKNRSIFSPFSVIGKFSIEIYVTHLIVLAIIGVFLREPLSPEGGLYVSCLLIVVIYIACRLLKSKLLMDFHERRWNKV